jgi:hypothetical protein
MAVDKPKTPDWPDWRDREQYRHMLDLDRAGWAWEWLRRNPDYPDGEAGESPEDTPRKGRARFEVAYPVLSEIPSRWGLCFR